MTATAPSNSDEPLLRVGFATTDVTPTGPLDMRMGRRENVDGAYDDLEVKVMAMDDGESRSVVLSAEILNWNEYIVDTFREGLAERFDLAPEQIILNASHTHEGPSRTATEYIDYLIGEGLETVGKAFENATPAHLYFSRGSYDMPVNRRGLTRDGLFVRQINPYGRIDPEIIALRAVDTDGTTLGVAVNYACHPTLVQVGAFGGDFVGLAMGMLEDDLGGDAVAMILNGTMGDVKPPNHSSTKPGRLRFGYEGGVEKATGVGREFADAVLEALDADSVEVRGTISTDLGTVDLPMMAERVDQVEEEPPFTGRSRRWAKIAQLMDEAMDDDGNYEETRSCEVYVLEIGDDFVLVGLNGEMNVPIGLRIKTQLQNRSAMVLAYTGYNIGYVPGYAQIPECGYEAGNPYSPEAEDFLVDKVMEMVSEGSELFWSESDDVSR